MKTGNLEEFGGYAESWGVFAIIIVKISNNNPSKMECQLLTGK